MARAELIAAPATCVCTSTPPGRTTIPVASIVRAPGPSTAATMLPPEIGCPSPRRGCRWPDRRPSAGYAQHACDAVVKMGPPSSSRARDRREGGGQPCRHLLDLLADAADHLLVRGIRRPEDQRGAGSRPCDRRFPGALMPVTAVVMWTRASRLGVGHLGVQHDGRDARQVVDGRLRHRRARIGAQDERGVVVPPDQHVDRGELRG